MTTGPIYNIYYEYITTDNTSGQLATKYKLGTGKNNYPYMVRQIDDYCNVCGRGIDFLGYIRKKVSKKLYIT